MSRSIFRRYLSITMVIVVLSFVLLGCVMVLFFVRFWQQEKHDTLTQNVRSVATIMGMADESTSEFPLQAKMLNATISTLAHNMESDIFITDLEGNVILGSFKSSGITEPKQLKPEFVQQAIAEGYDGKDTLGGFYRGKHFAVGIPLMIIAGSGEEVCVGTVFATVDAWPINAFIRDAVQIYFFAAVFALVITLLFVGLFSYSLVNPLRQMSAVVKTFGDGDFSVRVKVHSSDEIGQLGTSFNNMADSLSNSEAMRRSFIANVSHELRTPMTTIAGFVDGILDGTIVPSQQTKYMNIVSSEIKRLSRLVKSMMDLSRIDSGEMVIIPTQFDISKTIFNSLLAFERRIEEKNLEIRGLDELGQQKVCGDQDLLHQVIYNLIENAVKFSNDNGYIAFMITDSIDKTTLVIENSGVGIDPEELSMIFDRFYKTDKSRSRDKNGMGLGLYIVRTIIRLHGGEIIARSEVGKYCRFEFYIAKSKKSQSIGLDTHRRIETSGKLVEVEVDDAEYTPYTQDPDKSKTKPKTKDKNKNDQSSTKKGE